MAAVGLLGTVREPWAEEAWVVATVGGAAGLAQVGVVGQSCGEGRGSCRAVVKSTKASLCPVDYIIPEWSMGWTRIPQLRSSRPASKGQHLLWEPMNPPLVMLLLLEPQHLSQPKPWL